MFAVCGEFRFFSLLSLAPALPPLQSGMLSWETNLIDSKILMTNGTERKRKAFVFTRCRRKYPINQTREGWTDRSR